MERLTRTQKARLKILNTFVEPKLLPECAIQKKECPVALTPPSHLKQLDGMMKRMGDAFRAMDIEYVGCAGTALGVVRHGGFIPWDDDADYFITRRGFKLLQTKEIKEKLLKKYRLKLVTRFKPFGVLKLVLPGESTATSPVIDLCSTRELTDKKGKKYLMNEWMTRVALYLLNPSGTNVDRDILLYGKDYIRDESGRIRFLVKDLPWYNRTEPIPASGMQYVKRVFGRNCMTHAVLRIYVPVIARTHKFRDISGVYKLEGDLRPKLGGGGKVLKVAAAGELRSEATFKKNPGNKRFFRYYGQERSVVLRV